MPELTLFRLPTTVAVLKMLEILCSGSATS